VAQNAIKSYEQLMNYTLQKIPNEKIFHEFKNSVTSRGIVVAGQNFCTNKQNTIFLVNNELNNIDVFHFNPV
jgi:hypothetical protein